MAADERAGRVDPFGIAALAAAGTFAAHEIGYLVDSGDGPSHAYFKVLGPLVVIAASIAGWLAAVRLLRADGRTMVSLPTLCVVQIAGYLALEVGERVVAGDLGSLVSTPVVLGLVLQPVIAWLAIRLLAVGADALVRVFGAPTPRRPAAALGAVVAPAAPLRSVWTPGRFRLRGPPMV